ncbi:deoxyuridine 5'-triphosphate nucleotidohydrolase-like [Haliotis rufescens]|uniref:deoxyuridine 5'-triphosphate nucleotidohydrolase-like n=1 Tax=Haliotis rufescens TaxID=6454 RepID=UPI00201F9A6B|nr:deoxyuridine 5'-triphosphate nucleotidohydrolase-like [Haliotis rufescens]
MIVQRLFWRQIGVILLAPKLRAVVSRPPSNQFCKMPTDNVTLQFAKLTENGRAPTRGSKYAAGYDLYSAYDYVIPAGDKIIAKTDIQIAVPDGSYGRVAPRSGLAAKHFIDVGAGVIDQDYRGNVGVVMFNFSKEDFKVNSGDRIAQLICERIYIPELKELEELGNTERGSGGFGSTGKN